MTHSVKNHDSGECSDSTLVGQYFHSLNEHNKIEWQGVIVGRPEPGWYLVQTFEWAMGEPEVRYIKHIEAMSNWLFYADRDTMIFAYEHGVARPGGVYQDE